jgi:hypothetical protein
MGVILEPGVPPLDTFAVCRGAVEERHFVHSGGAQL